MEWSIKLIGAVIIISVGIMIGKYSVNRLSGRGGMLSEIIDVLGSIHNNFLYRQSDVITALNEAGEIQRKFFTVNLLKLNNTDFKRALEKRLQSCDNLKIFLNDSQHEKLYDALLLIGTGSLEEECGRLMYYIEYFNGELRNATDYEKKNRKLYFAMSVYASIVLSLILI